MRKLGVEQSRSRFAQTHAPAIALSALLLAISIVALSSSQALARHRARTPVTTPAEGESGEAPQLKAPFVSECLMEPTTGTVIVDKDMHKPWPLASVTKMMLMLIVAEKLHDGSLKLTDQITTSRRAAQMGGSQVYLREGEAFPLDDMMKAVVVHSANDASVAVAEYIGGSTDAFVQMMNQEAARLGMKDTHYYSVHGQPPEPGAQFDVSSAYDCALLAQQLVKYPVILKWSGIDTAPFRGGSFILRNTNHLVRTFPGCDGLKTGFYYKAGFNVVATAQRNGTRMIAVVLGSPHKLTNFKLAAELMSEGFAQYEIYQVAKKGAPISKPVLVVGGAAPNFVPVWEQDVTVLIRRGDEKSVNVSYKLPESVPAPVKAGLVVGTATVQAGNQSITSNVLAPKQIEQKSLLHRLL